MGADILSRYKYKGSGKDGNQEIEWKNLSNYQRHNTPSHYDRTIMGRTIMDRTIMDRTIMDGTTVVQYRSQGEVLMFMFQL